MADATGSCCLCLHRVNPVCPTHAAASPEQESTVIVHDVLRPSERHRAVELGRCYADIEEEQRDPLYERVRLDVERFAEDRERLTEWVSESMWREWPAMGPLARCEALALALQAYTARTDEIDTEDAAAAAAACCALCGWDDCDSGASCPASGE